MENKIILPLGETVRRSFMYVFLHAEQGIKICSAWFILLLFEISTDFPVLCSLSEDVCPNLTMKRLSVFFLSMAGIGIIVKFCRHIILHENNEGYWNLSFGKRELRYFLNSLIYTLIILLPMYCLTLILGRALMSPIIILLTLVLLLFLMIIISRLYLVFPATAVENHNEITFKKSWEITKGNANKIFWGQVLMMLPIALIGVCLSLTYRAIGSDNYILNLIFSFLMILLSFVDSLLKASYFSHLYQYFMYFYHKENEQEGSK